jgi:hypothetical protein
MTVVTHNEFNSHMRRLDEKLDAHARQMDAHARSLDEKLEIYARQMDAHARSLDEKLEVYARQMDAHAHHLDEKLEVYARQMEGQIARLDERIENNARLLGLRVQSIEKQHQAFVVESKSLKTTVITTGIASVLGIVVGVGAFNATVLSSMNASFESGKNTATSLMQASTELRQTQERMERLFGEMQKHDALQSDQ